MKLDLNNIKPTKIIKVNDKLTAKYYIIDSKRFVSLEHFAHEEPILFKEKTFEKLMNSLNKKSIHN